MAGMGLPLAYGGAAGADTLENVIAQRQALNEFNRQLRLDEQRRLIAEREAAQRERGLGLQERELGENAAWRAGQTDLQRRQLDLEGQWRESDRALRERLGKQEYDLGQWRNRIDEMGTRAQAGLAGANAERIRNMDRSRREAEMLLEKISDPAIRRALAFQIKAGVNVNPDDIDPYRAHKFRMEEIIAGRTDPMLGLMGQGGAPGAAPAPSYAPGQTARNPETGETATYNGQTWTPTPAPGPMATPPAPMWSSHQRTPTPPLALPPGEQQVIPDIIRRGMVINALRP